MNFWRKRKVKERQEDTEESTVIYLFPDTNLFIQCRSLDELEWKLWEDYTEVRLMVSRPVQREIDNQKSKGRGRVNKRARSAASLFREIILGDDGFELVRDEKPRVTLRIASEYLPDQDLANQLDYGERDDQLVGTISSFIKTQSGAVAQLLTQDSGPLASAKMVGIPFAPIPDDWLLEPEGTEKEKSIRALEDQIARLKSTEPLFDIYCEDADGNRIESLEFAITRYESLSDEQIEMLMSEIRTSFPMETEFGSKEPAERRQSQGDPLGIFGYKWAYEPAKEEEINAYCDERYPAWLDKCEYALRSLHQARRRRDGAPLFCAVAHNVGTRPARDALITIEARGHFQIIPRRQDDEEGNEENGVAANSATSIALPTPPKAPNGRWIRRGGFDIANLAGLRSNLGIFDPPGISAYRPNIDLLEGLQPNRRDPNAFYYKPSRPMLAGPSFALECEQWRHGVDPEVFCGEIHVDSDKDEVCGALECRIHAENLSEIASVLVPVRIYIQSASTFDFAKLLVSELRVE